MKKRINLFTLRESQRRAIIFASRIRLVLTIAGVIFVIGLIGLNVLQVQQITNINNLNAEKQRYLDYLVENKNIEAKLRYFKNKQSQMTNFLKDDAQFLPYYTLLKDTISSSSESATIESIVIDKSQKTEFIVRFADYDNMIRFFNYVESDSFLKHFSELSLTQFNIFENSANTKKKNYKLIFSGKFKIIQSDGF